MVLTLRGSLGVWDQNQQASYSRNLYPAIYPRLSDLNLRKHYCKSRCFTKALLRKQVLWLKI